MPTHSDALRFVGGRFISQSFGLGFSALSTSIDGQNWTNSAKAPSSIFAFEDFASDGKGTFAAITESNIYCGTILDPTAGASKIAPDMIGGLVAPQGKLNKAGTAVIFKGAATVTNLGGKPAKDVQAALYVTNGADGSDLSDATYLGMLPTSDLGIPKLGRGKSSGAVPFKFKLPLSELPSRMGNRLLLVIDPDNTTGDANPANNTVLSPALSD